MQLKTKQDILTKLGIEKLNPMQEETQLKISSGNDVVLLSPTGTGKTLAFLLPIIERLDINLEEVQALIVVPTRELAIQIDQVIRSMGAGIKSNAVYGGRAGSKDRIELKHLPTILVGTPGRVADHIRKEVINEDYIKTLVLDEFDKSLEIGFESEMKEIIYSLREVNQRILTSATKKIEVPSFAGVNNPEEINYLSEENQQLQVKTVVSPDKDKLATLVNLLSNLDNQPGIIFCNFKETIQRVSDYLNENNISHGCFYGGLEQKDRERALIKFRNGTHQLLLATDLAARGIDVPEIKFIIHYHLPLKLEEFTHRNGRTARMNSDGTAFVLRWGNEPLPEFITEVNEFKLEEKPSPKPSEWQTLFISGGRKDKISKGDVAGVFFKQGGLTKDEFGTIELMQDCVFVGVKASKTTDLIEKLNNTRLKKKKVRVYLV